MSETGTVVLESVAATDCQRNVETINRHQIGRGPAHARVYNDATQAIATGTETVVTFNTERYDTGGFHSTSANTGRLIAPTAGLYLVGANIAFAANGTGVRIVYLRLNGAERIAAVSSPANATVDNGYSPSTMWQMGPGDYVEVLVTQNSGGNLNVLASIASGAGTLYGAEFWIVRLGSQA
jgi:hypothetical protein